MLRAWLAAATMVLGLASTAIAGLAAGEVTVAGNRFLRDGVPWVAEGVTLVGLVSPEGLLRNKLSYAAARAAFGPDMLDEVRRFGADTVRFQVSQTGLDPQSPDHDPAYRDEVLDAVALTRAAGFTVIVSMQWQGVSGRRGESMPTGATRRAWRSIVPAFAEDRGVLLEVFNEPETDPRTPAEWEASWRRPMQGLVDTLRRAGSRNVLLVDGAQFARNFQGAPALDDPLGQVGYAVHPYLGRYNRTRAQWEKKWGGFARRHPVIATEWNASSGGGYCWPEMEARAEALLDYLAEQRIGLVAWALDLPTLMEADGSYTTLDDLVCGERRDGGRGGAGQLIHEHFLAH